MTVRELKGRHVDIFGEQARTGNKDYLVKRIASRLQVLAEGNITKRAVRRTQELAMSRLTLNILLSFGQFEREIISERTRDRIAAARRRGKWTGGPPVLGYDRLRDGRGPRLGVNEDEARRIRTLFQKHMETGSILATVRWLNKRKWASKRYETFAGKVRQASPPQHADAVCPSGRDTAGRAGRSTFAGW